MDYAQQSPGGDARFWVIKILATTLGETGGDAVTMSAGSGYLAGTGIFAVILIVLVTAQIRASGFNRPLYWAVLADFCDSSLGIGYIGGDWRAGLS